MAFTFIKLIVKAIEHIFFDLVKNLSSNQNVNAIEKIRNFCLYFIMEMEKFKL